MTTTYAMELSSAGFEAMLLDLSMMDRKTGFGYLRLLAYLRRFGSVPSDERSFASILGITVRYLRERAWPLLEDRIVLSDDGRRYFDPDITPARKRDAVGRPAVDDPRKNQQQRDAANIRHTRERMQKDALAHADRMRSDAETHANSMRGASKTHAENDADRIADASPDASGASRAPPPPLASSSFSQPVQTPGESEEGRKQEGEGARASADAPAHADRMRLDASAHADRMRSDAPRHAERMPGRTRMTADWAPSAADRQFASGLGYNPDEIAAAMRDHYLSNGETRLDWGARYRSWCREEAKRDAQRQQGNITMAIPGGAAPRQKEGRGIAGLVERHLAGGESALSRDKHTTLDGRAEEVGRERSIA
jgi:hypothetical protein